MNLVIIEAIGKIKTVELLAKNKWGKDTRVLATGGYLYTLPDDNVGIDPYTFRANDDRRTKHSYFFEKELVKYSQQYGAAGHHFLLMTDPDREGEGIAEQSKKLIEKYFVKPTFQRVYVNELTFDGVTHAHVENNTHAGIVASFEARRVLDRLLPLSVAHQLHRAGDFVGLGRLQTAALRVVGDKSKEWHKFVLEGWWKSDHGSYYVREYSNSEDNLRRKMTALKHAVHEEKPIIIEQSKYVEPPKPFSAQELMAQTKHIRPEKIMECLQRSYIEGRLSYPRTDQNVLGIATKRVMAAIVGNLHLSHQMSNSWHQEDDTSENWWVQGAHPGLHPTFNWAPSFKKPSNETEYVEAVVAARALASVMKPAILERSLRTIFTEDGEPFSVVHDRLSDAGWTSIYERLGLDNPLTPKLEFTKAYPSIKEQYPVLSHVIEWLNDEHLGRPATLSVLPSKLQSLNLLSSACIPTRYGDRQLQEIYNVMPQYTFSAFTKFMEDGLKHLIDEPNAYASVVKNILIQAGADVISLPQAVQMATPVDYEDVEINTISQLSM